MASEADCSAIVLVGGGSRRFGTDKARAEWRQQRLVDHVAAGLRPISREIILVAGLAQRGVEWPADQVVYDNPDHPPGPLRGLVRGLEACRTEYAWVVACDAPLPQTALLLALRQAARPGDLAVVPIWEGRPQPLLACYAVAGAALLGDLLAGGEQSPREALAGMKVQSFAAERCREHDPAGLSFLNINTPQDLARLDSLIDA